jgi:hypothetical protein
VFGFKGKSPGQKGVNSENTFDSEFGQARGEEEESGAVSFLARASSDSDPADTEIATGILPGGESHIPTLGSRDHRATGGARSNREIELSFPPDWAKSLRLFSESFAGHWRLTFESEHLLE